MSADLRRHLAPFAIGVLLAIPLGAHFVQTYRLSSVQGQLVACERAEARHG